MKVGVLAVEEEGVRSPDFVQKLPIHGQLTGDGGSVVHQPLIIPWRQLVRNLASFNGKMMNVMCQTETFRDETRMV